MQDTPKVSVVIATLNAAGALPACLESIRAQDYPADRIEVVLGDGGSTDATLDVARAHGVSKIVPNPRKTAEAGKSEALKVADGELIAVVDSDNILDSPEWMRKMTAPFADPEIVAAEPLEYTWRAQDPALTRYFAMLGMNDPLCLFLGNYDRRCLITGKWTGLDVETETRPGFIKVALARRAMPTIGANGFMFRRSLLEHVTWSPYFFDIDIMCEAVAKGLRHVAKVECGVVHLYCATLRDFVRKQSRRVNDYLYFRGESGRSYPWNAIPSRRIAAFALATAALAPLLVQMGLGCRRKADAAWLYHVPACWITLFVYGAAGLKKAAGLKPAMQSREAWKQVG